MFLYWMLEQNACGAGLESSAEKAGKPHQPHLGKPESLMSWYSRSPTIGGLRIEHINILHYSTTVLTVVEYCSRILGKEFSVVPDRCTVHSTYSSLSPPLYTFANIFFDVAIVILSITIYLKTTKATECSASPA